MVGRTLEQGARKGEDRRDLRFLLDSTDGRLLFYAGPVYTDSEVST